MPAVFDPYHKWLGIPPKDQPPNHYRLLGIDLFEADRDVIDSAANQRMAYLQELATGPHVGDSQKLLNEVSAARRCLLNSAAKAAYDEELRANQPSAAGGAWSVDVNFPSSTTTEQPAPGSFQLATDDEPQTSSQRPISKSVLIQSGIAAAALVLIVVLLLSRGSSEPGQERDGARAGFKPSIKTGIVLEWPLRDRTGAMVIIDGEKQDLAKQPFLEFTLPPGDHRAIVVREGYNEILLDVSLEEGQVEKYRLDWKKSLSN